MRPHVQGQGVFGSKRHQHPQHDVDDGAQSHGYQAQQHGEDADDHGIDAQDVGEAGAYAARHRVTRSLPSFPRHSASPIAPTARRGAGRIEPVWKVSPIRSSRYSASLAGASSDEAPSSEGSASSAAGASMRLTRMVEMRRRRMAWILNR